MLGFPACFLLGIWPKAKAAALKALEVDDNLVRPVAPGWPLHRLGLRLPTTFQRAPNESRFSRGLLSMGIIYLGGRGRFDEAPRRNEPWIATQSLLNEP